jgi:hypothetical protein
MDRLSLEDPLFATYVIAASLMILKAVTARRRTSGKRP